MNLLRNELNLSYWLGGTMSDPEYVKPYVLFNDINHGKTVIFLDFRNRDDFSMCRIKNSIALPIADLDTVGIILDERYGHCKPKSILLFWLLDGMDAPEIVKNKFHEVSKLVDTSEAESIWSKIKLTRLLDFEEFFSIYGKCASLFEGDAIKDEDPSNYGNEYPSEIIPNFMFLGSFFSATDPVVLKSLDITHVVDASGEHSSKEVAEKLKLDYLPIVIWDDSDVDIATHFEAVHSFVDKCRSKNNGRVLIHCRAGISRSATFVLAYLLHSRVCSDLREALSMVLEQRPYIMPNVGFRNQIIDYEMKLLGCESFATSKKMTDFMRTKNTTWVGNFSVYDRMPIAAAKTFGVSSPFVDELPPVNVVEVSKPKKSFLKRGQGKTAATVKKSIVETNSDGTGDDSGSIQVAVDTVS